MREVKSTILEKGLSSKKWGKLNCSPFEIFINPMERKIIEKLGRYSNIFTYDNDKEFKKDILYFFRVSGGDYPINCGNSPIIYNKLCQLGLDHICKL